MRKILKIACVVILIFFVNICFFKTEVLADTTGMDGIFSSADDFIATGEKSSMEIDRGALKSGSELIYNILLAIGTVAAVIVGVILGIQFMVSSADKKAEIKETLMGYTVGCIIIFGGFGIWKVVVLIGNSF